METKQRKRKEQIKKTLKPLTNKTEKIKNASELTTSNENHLKRLTQKRQHKYKTHFQ